MRYLAAAIGVFIFVSCIALVSARISPKKDAPRASSAGAAKPSLSNVGNNAEVDTEEYAGEFFGVKVPLNNYYFIRNAVVVFGNKQGRKLPIEKEVEEITWEQLLLSFLAYQENITVSQEEVEQEVEKTLSGAGADPSLKKDRQAYQTWLKEKINESPEVFENQIRHLIQLEKLRKYITEKIEPQVSDEEIYQAFFNEAGVLNIEFVLFDAQLEAEEFYKKISRRKNLWEQEKKKRPGDFKSPGSVSVAFLVDLWAIPQDAATKMMKKNVGEFYPPRPVHKKVAVFKILDTHVADEAQYAKSKESYVEKVKIRKKFEGYNNWLKNFKESAHIQVYSKPSGGVSSETSEVGIQKLEGK